MFNQISEKIFEEMDSVISYFNQVLSTLRTGRAHPDLLKPISVEVYGAKTPLFQMGRVDAVDVQMLSVTIWDYGSVKATEKALQNQGWTFQTEGNVLRVNVPPLSKERRYEMVKMARRHAEEAKVSLKNIRQKFIDKIKKIEKESPMPQDEKRATLSKIDDLTKQYNQKILDVLKIKEKDITEF